MDSDMGNNPIGRWFGLCMDNMIGADYEKGLAKLKEVSEKAPVAEQVAGFDVEMKTMPAQKYIYLDYKNVKMQELGLKIGEAFTRLNGFVKENKYTMTGPPFTIWPSMENFSAAFPVAEDVKAEKELRFRNESPYNAYVVKYYGAYDKNMHVYEAMDAFIKEKGAKPAGPPREVYITDPELEKDTAKWLTEMVFPVSN
jgi:effector-binding domain-containing protein